MRVFLAGATGVIGRRMIRLLVADGHHVVGLTRSVTEVEALESLGAEAVIADVFDAEALTAAVTAAEPDAVVHQLTDLRGNDRAANSRIRQQGTANLVAASQAAGVRRIVAQSIGWAYRPGDEPAAEAEPLDLASGADRLTSVTGIAALESAVQAVPEWVALRYGTLYGPDTWYAADGLMAQAARDGQLPATADVNSFVHVDDAAAAAVAALEWPSGAVNIVDDEPAVGTDWVPIFCETVGAPEPSMVDTPRTPWARGADNTYARHELLWTPRWPSWRAGFAAI